MDMNVHNLGEPCTSSSFTVLFPARAASTSTARSTEAKLFFFHWWSDTADTFEDPPFVFDPVWASSRWEKDTVVSRAWSGSVGSDFSLFCTASAFLSTDSAIFMEWVVSEESGRRAFALRESFVRVDALDARTSAAGDSSSSCNTTSDERGCK